MIIQDKKTKEKLDLHYQKYSIGLYVAIYKDGRLFDQFGTDQTPNQLIEGLKQNFNIL